MAKANFRHDRSTAEDCAEIFADLPKLGDRCDTLASLFRICEKLAIRTEEDENFVRFFFEDGSSFLIYHPDIFFPATVRAFN